MPTLGTVPGFCGVTRGRPLLLYGHSEQALNGRQGDAIREGLVQHDAARETRVDRFRRMPSHQGERDTKCGERIGKRIDDLAIVQANIEQCYVRSALSKEIKRSRGLRDRSKNL